MASNSSFISQFSHTFRQFCQVSLSVRSFPCYSLFHSSRDYSSGPTIPLVFVPWLSPGPSLGTSSTVDVIYKVPFVVHRSSSFSTPCKVRSPCRARFRDFLLVLCVDSLSLPRPTDSVFPLWSPVPPKHLLRCPVFFLEY